MKTFTNKVIGILLVVIAGLLLANLATMWLQQGEVRSQTVGKEQLTVIPLSSGGFSAPAPPGCAAPGCFWSMYLVLSGPGTTPVIRDVCFIAYNPGPDNMVHRCSKVWWYKEGP